jgi:hypothetical protein
VLLYIIFRNLLFQKKITYIKSLRVKKIKKNIKKKEKNLKFCLFLFTV